MLTQFTQARWNALCDALGVAAHHHFDQIQSAYAEPHRAYHTAQHIDECLGLLNSVSHSLHDAALVELCIWLHDVIYEPRRADNEARSAALATHWFASMSSERLAKLQRYILATRHHLPNLQDMDMQALLDIDLAILAAPPQRFKEYSKQIRFEYKFVFWPIYVFKRGQFMRQLMSRQPIYHHPQLAPRLQSSLMERLA